MDDLNIYRSQLDDINIKLTSLYQDRLEVVKKIKKYKKDNNLPVFDANRENLIIKNVQEKVKPEYSEYIKRFFQFIMNESKFYQNLE